MANREKRGWSLGTVTVLCLLLIVSAGLVYVLPRLSGGTVPDLSSLENQVVLSFSDELPELQAGPQVQITAVPQPETVQVPAEPVSVSYAQASVPRGGSFTVTFGGTVSISEKIRKSAYASDAKVYDFSEMMSLLTPQLTSDLNAVFLENLLTDAAAYTSLIAPTAAAGMLSQAGFDTVFTGFSQAYDKGQNGLNSTLSALRAEGLMTFGAYDRETDAAACMVERNGLKIALLQYTEALSSTGAKQIRKSGAGWSVPVVNAATVAEQIASVRSAGADVVIVCMNWGNVGSTSPSKNQVTLAQQIADAGADLIIGSGSQTVQPVTYLTRTAEDGSKYAVLCAYSIGSLLNGNRDKMSRMAGMLLHVDISVDENGRVNIRNAAYTPTYTWYYRMDGINYYRTLSATGTVPDGMASDQQKYLKKAAETVTATLAGSPVVLR